MDNEERNPEEEISKIESKTPIPEEMLESEEEEQSDRTGIKIKKAVGLAICIAVIALGVYFILPFNNVVKETTMMPPSGDMENSATADASKPYTELLVQLYENSNNGEFDSTLKRYCAGQDTAGTDDIDTLVRNRNRAASSYANVNVKYIYETSYGWGGAVEDIQNLSKSGSASAPDIFANFVYDMTSAALRGCFANLYANTDRTTTKYGNGKNYLEFTKSGYVGINPDSYFDYNAGSGYLYDYMQSLAFVNENGVYDKMYCLASNYTMDAIRAMQVVPVNVKMLEEITVEATADTKTGNNYDLDGNGAFDIEDFYHLVWNYDWTYDALARLSKAVYQDANTAVAGADIKDTLGFALGKSSGLSASGMLYSSVKIIEKTTVEGKVTYCYPETCDSLVDFTYALNSLFRSTGICSVSSADAKALFSNANSDLEAIRNRFAENKLLFGGVTLVGSFEDAVYQQMNAPGMKGFGFVPVPLYKQDADHSYQYSTQVHNLARLFAISNTTTKFEQCTDFLNYQSVNSDEVFEAYCQKYSSSQNLEMLAYIRNHVRDCFDKTYEDVIFRYQLAIETNVSSSRWHTVLANNGYMVTNMSTLYSSVCMSKQLHLDTVLMEWSRLI